MAKRRAGSPPGLRAAWRPSRGYSRHVGQRPDRARAVEFVEVDGLDDDLLPVRDGFADLGPSSTSPVPPMPPPASSPVPPSAPVGRPRRRLLVVTAAVAALFGGLAAVDEVTSRAHAARIVAQSGGLYPMASVPTERWRAPMGSGMVTGLGDALVVVGDGLVGRDPATGEVLWRTPEWGPTGCEPVPYPGVDLGSTIVCVTPTMPWTEEAPTTPDPTPHTVRVVGEGGQILSERVVDDAVVVAMPPSDVLRVHLRPGAAVVRREDAATGEERWTRAVPRSTDDAVWGYDENGDVYVPPLGLWTWNGLVQVQGDGVDAVLDESGKETEGGPWPSWNVVLPDGLRLDQAASAADAASGTATVRVVDGGGRAVWSAKGQVVAPAVTDGDPERVVVVVRGARTRGLDPADGSEIWAFDTRYEAALARVGSVLVLSDYRGLVGVDVESGRILWDYGGRPTGDMVLTDGERVLTSVLGADPDAESPRLVALGLSDGDLQWGYETERQMYGAFAVGGRLIAFESSDDGTDIVGLG